MTVLVTGGAGYIGGHMVRGLLDAGERVVVMDNMSNGVPWAVPSGVPFVQSEVGNYEVLSRTIVQFGVDEIIHLAARLIEPELYRNPLEYYRVNSAQSRTLIAAALAHEIRHFIYSGTAAVYGDPPSNPVAETAPLAPISAYGTSKLVTEFMLRDAHAVSDLRFVTLRYFNVAGADPLTRYGQSTTKTTLLVQIAIQAALGVRPYIEIFGDDYPTPDGTCIRDYIHVTDLVEAHLMALRFLRNGGKCLTANCGYGHGYSVKQVLDTVAEVSGKRFERRLGARRTGDATAVVADANLVRSELGWRPRFDDLPTIVEHALKWEMRLRKLYGFGNVE